MKQVRNHENLMMFIIDVLRHDCAEQIASVVTMLNNEGCIGWRDHWPTEFQHDEVQDALFKLIARGDVITLIEDSEPPYELVPVPMDRSSSSEVWYSLTDRGRTRWEQWNPPQ